MRNKRVRPVVWGPPSETKTICHGAPPLIGTRDCTRAIAMRIKANKKIRRGEKGSRVPHSRIHTHFIHINIYVYIYYMEVRCIYK